MLNPAAVSGREGTLVPAVVEVTPLAVVTNHVAAPQRSACPSTPVLEFPSDVLQQQVTFIFELAAGLQLLVGKAISSSTNSYKGTTELNLDFIHLPLRGTTV